MQNISPALRYQQALGEKGYQTDDVQRDAITRLDNIWWLLVNEKRESACKNTGMMGRIGKFLRFRQTEINKTPVQGLYLWGGVGRGKTWLMDLFFQSLPGERKLRLHFHRFMLRVHEELAAIQGQVNPLEKIADGFKAQTDVLCFDEFFVSDITDAMLLGSLMAELFSRGITLIATSNIPPDELYHNGLQRARFLPAIAAIKQHCDVINVDTGIDYRLRTLTQAHLWLSPLNSETEKKMQTLYFTLTGCEQWQQHVMEINHRQMVTLGMVNQILAVDYKTLCVEARNQHDYIVISQKFQTVLLFNVPVMTALNESEARRFIALIDEFYERHVKLIVSAETSFFIIYQGDKLKFEFQRCLSRLQEMQSEEYLRLGHLP